MKYKKNLENIKSTKKTHELDEERENYRILCSNTPKSLEFLMFFFRLGKFDPLSPRSYAIASRYLNFFFEIFRYKKL